MVKTQTIPLSKISQEISNRFDVNFLSFQILSEQKGYVGFNELFDVVDKAEVDLPEEFQYCEIGNVEKTGDIIPVLLDENKRDETNYDLFKKIEKGDIIKSQKGDILISSVRPNLKKYVFIDSEKEKIYFTKAFVHLRPKQNGILLYYLLRGLFFENIISISREGKGYPTIKIDDLKYLKFDGQILNKVFQYEKEITPKIEKIEQEIKKLKSKLCQPQEIINKVFAEEFGFNLEGLKRAKHDKIINTFLSGYSKNEDLRFGFRFHNAAGKTALKILKGFADKKIRDFLSEPIRLGAGISPKFYDDENGEAYYLTMATIKNWCFETEEAKKVSKDYWESEKENNSVRKDDIIVARSGEGTIGKIAIVENNEDKAIFCDFTMRIRLVKYNPLFAYYYFRTDLFQSLIESNKKGLGNNTNIFPSQIKEFPIPDTPLKRQNVVVEKIKSQLDEQEQKKHTIGQKRQEIDRIIEGTLKRK